MKKYVMCVICLLFCFCLCSCQIFTSNSDNEVSKTEDNRTEDDSDMVLSLLSGLSDINDSEELIEFSQNNFENSTISDYIAGKDDTEVNLLLKVFKKIKFISVYNNSLRYSVISTDSIFNYLQNDQSFIKEFNNLKTIGISEKEMSDYLNNYLCQILDSVEFDDNADRDEKNSEITIIGKKISSDVFLVQVSDLYLKDLIEKIETSEFTEANQEENVTFGDSYLEKGKGAILPYSIYNEENKLTQTVKLFIKINDVLKNDDALQKIKDLNSMNSAINVDYSNDNIVYVNYSIVNYSGKDINYNNNFMAVDEKGTSYTLSLGTILGVTPSTVCKNATETTLDVVIIYPKHASVGYYDSASKNFYKLKDVD